MLGLKKSFKSLLLPFTAFLQIHTAKRNNSNRAKKSTPFGMSFNELYIDEIRNIFPKVGIKHTNIFKDNTI